MSPRSLPLKERLLVLTEAVFDAFGTVEDFATLFPETAARFIAVNGVREPTITMRLARSSAGGSCMPVGRTTSSWSCKGMS